MNILKKKKCVPVYIKLNQNIFKTKHMRQVYQLSHITCYYVSSKPGGKDHVTAFPAKYKICIQQLPHGIKIKQEKNIPLDQQDVRHLLACIYNHVTGQYENAL